MQLSLHNGSSSGATMISNIFIDYYMPRANGEFVKIYLYLLRCLRGGNEQLDLSAVADVFDCTEADVLRTLRYWEAQKLVVLSGSDALTSIDFLEPMQPGRRTAPMPAVPREQPAGSVPETRDSKAPEKKVPDESSLKKQIPPKNRLSADRIRELQGNPDIKEMFFIAESYLGTTLSRSVTDELLYIYEELHFSIDLIDYLIEYCVSKGSGDIHYIKKVAFSWYEEGITSVAEAKKNTTTFHRNYFTILKAFGITNRNPVTNEINMINHWIRDYGFTMDILTEACARTVASTGKANFQYADKILSNWKDKGVRHLSDIQALDTLHKQLQADRLEQKKRQSPKNSGGNGSNRFNNFKQRNYDYSELENRLLQ